MKKIGIFIICFCLLASLLAGCDGTRGEEVLSDTQATETEADTASDIVYKTPADAASIDLTAADPSNDRIQFSYDENNRISLCQYQLDGHTIKVTYSYSDNDIQIYAFSDEYVAADETFTVSAYDANAGFTTQGGYYFCGCVF